MEFGFRTKVQEKAYLELRSAEIVQELTFRCLWSFECRLSLDDQPLVDDHVDALHCQNVPLIRHVRAYLASNPMPTHVKLPLERHHIDMLVKAEAENVVNLIESANDGTRESLFE